MWFLIFLFFIWSRAGKNSGKSQTKPKKSQTQTEKSQTKTILKFGNPIPKNTEVFGFLLTFGFRFLKAIAMVANYSSQYTYSTHSDDEDSENFEPHRNSMWYLVTHVSYHAMYKV